MKRFDRVKLILDALVANKTVRAHGPFWRGKTLEEFKKLTPLGQRLLISGDGAESNLVKALRAQAPFGSDVGTAGAFFRRMPAGMPGAEEAQIQYISDWIDDGCPDDDETAASLFEFKAEKSGLPEAAFDHNAYWREFDDWAMFNASDATRAAIDQVFAFVMPWSAYAKGSSDGGEWRKAIGKEQARNAIVDLSARQRNSVARVYGDPPAIDILFESYKGFGEGSLPRDPLRPEDEFHRMDGETMWFVWSAFADSCLEIGVDTGFWAIESRALLIGLIHDGLFRGRYRIQGFSADEVGSAEAIEYVRNLPDAELQNELRRRYAQSGR